MRTRVRAQIPTQVLKGKAAKESLMQRQMPDWQALQVMSTARLYGLTNIPIDGGFDTMCVEYDRETQVYTLGPYKLVLK